MSTKILLPLLEMGVLNSNDNIARLMKSKYGEALTRTYGYMRTDYFMHIHMHGQMHMERVALLGALVAMNEGFSEEDTALSLFACIYHDIGRDSLHYRESHGPHSAQMLMEGNLFEDIGVSDKARIALLQAAIATHSMNDGMLGEMEALFGVPESEHGHCRRICFCLKDADNLDRVRIGDLNTSFLRYPCSPTLVDTAEFIFDITKKFDS